MTNGYGAEYGARGRVMNVSLKSGTNEIHGALSIISRTRSSMPIVGRTTWRDRIADRSSRTSTVLPSRAGHQEPDLLVR